VPPYETLVLEELELVVLLDELVLGLLEELVGVLEELLDGFYEDELLEED
jgi:hypothetical protein